MPVSLLELLQFLFDVQSLLFFCLDLVAECLQLASRFGNLVPRHRSLFALGLGPLVRLLVLEGGVDEARRLDFNWLTVHELDFILSIEGALGNSLEDAGGRDGTHVFEVQIVGL